MATILKHISKDLTAYHANKKRYGREEAQSRVAYNSRCVYVGNLTFVTTDYQLHELFSSCGPVERVVMGLNRITKTPAGFAFVIFKYRESVFDAINNLNGIVIDTKPLKLEVDKGFHEGKEFGRGSSGGQVRDEIEGHYDPLRAGMFQNREYGGSNPSHRTDGKNRRYDNNNGRGRNWNKNRNQGNYNRDRNFSRGNNYQSNRNVPRSSSNKDDEEKQIQGDDNNNSRGRGNDSDDEELDTGKRRRVDNGADLDN